MHTPHSRSTVFRLSLVALFAGVLALGWPAVGNCQETNPPKPKTPPPAKPKTPPPAKPQPKPSNQGNPAANAKASQDAAKAKREAAEKAKREAEKAKKKAELAALEDVKFKQAEVLREAYVLAAAANGDYAGHRAKAMNHLRAAVKLLEAGLEQHGSAKSKMMARYEDAIAGRTVGPRPAVHEAQLVSDVQMRNAAALLQKALPEVVKLNEKNVHHHLDSAITEIAIALKVN